jgi:hypothetical protein
MKKTEVACKHSRVFPMGDMPITGSRWQRSETSVQFSAVECSEQSVIE